MIRASALPLLLLPLAAQTTLTSEQQRGRQIYEHGTSATGVAITASIGPGAPVAGTVVPCANCHGADGLGRAEGGIVPADVTWDALTKPYGIRRTDGRTRAPYTERLVRRAITMGLDPEGNALHKAMPRYQLSQADASDVVAYLKVIGRSYDPGVTATTVQIGAILPAGQGGTVIREALARQFAAVNRSGGIFGRTIELVPVERADDSVFALCGDFSGKEREIADSARASGMPAIATVAAAPDLRSPLNPYVFYLDGGTAADSESLWTHAVATGEILIDGMRRAGRGLTRRSLLEALDGFKAVKTSLPEPITFGPNRRVGSSPQK